MTTREEIEAWLCDPNNLSRPLRAFAAIRRAVEGLEDKVRWPDCKCSECLALPDILKILRGEM